MVDRYTPTAGCPRTDPRRARGHLARRSRKLARTAPVTTTATSTADWCTLRKPAMAQASHAEASKHHEAAAKSHKMAAELHGKGDAKAAAKHAEEAHGHSAKAHESSTKAHGKSAGGH